MWPDICWQRIDQASAYRQQTFVLAAQTSFINDPAHSVDSQYFETKK